MTQENASGYARLFVMLTQATRRTATLQLAPPKLYSCESRQPLCDSWYGGFQRHIYAVHSPMSRLVFSGICLFHWIAPPWSTQSTHSSSAIYIKGSPSGSITLAVFIPCHQTLARKASVLVPTPPPSLRHLKEPCRAQPPLGLPSHKDIALPR